MKWDVLEDVFNDIAKFFERLFGWFTYVFGGADDPYGFDGVLGGKRD